MGKLFHMAIILVSKVHMPACSSDREHPDNQHMENLELLKKYFTILGYDEDKIFIQSEILDYETENSLLLKTPVVIKEGYGTN